MKNGFRIAIASAALMVGLSFAGASLASAQVSFEGTFPLPHGVISIGIGDPAFRIGAYVPLGYRVDFRPDCGYGFEYGRRWIPVRPYRSRWIVCQRPYGVYVDGGCGYHSYPRRYRYYWHDHDRGHRRWDDHRDHHRSDRDHDRDHHHGHRRY